MPDTVTAAIAGSVRAELARAGISARQLAAEFGVNRGWAHRRLAGMTPFTPAELVRIAAHLGIPVTRLYDSGETATSGKAAS